MNQTGNSINMNFTNFVLHSQINEGTFINNMSLYLNNYGTNFFNQSQYLLPILFFGAYNDTRYGLLQFNCSIQFQLYFFLTSPPPPTLSSITPNPSTTGNITLQWTSSTGAISYNIYQYPSPILVINGSVSQVCTRQIYPTMINCLQMGYIIMLFPPRTHLEFQLPRTA